MVGIAFDLRGPPLVTLDEEADTRPGKRHRRREEQRLPGHELFRLTDVWNDHLVRLPRARRHTRQGERCTHQLEEATTADRIEPLRSVLRELAMQVFLELGRFSDGFEAAPVFAPAGALQFGAERLYVGTHERVTGDTSSNRCWA